VFLLDTNVVSEMRRTRPHPAVVEWLSKVPSDELFVAAVTLGELQAGVEMTRRQDSVRASAIEAWIDTIAASYNVLPMDAVTFRQWARLMHRQPRNLIEDAMIAATALVHNLTVATRNVRDFERLDVAVIDPFRRVP
jgi:toxin FitB